MLLRRNRRERMQRAQRKQLQKQPRRQLHPARAAAQDEPAILRSAVVHPVIKIINMLDPVSYLTLAMASKKMRQLCRHKSIRKEFKNEQMRVCYHGGDGAQVTIFTEMSPKRGWREVRDVEKHAKMVKKMQETLPVTVTVDCVSFVETQQELADFDLTNPASQFLRKMGVSRVNAVDVSAWLHLWREFAQFIEEFHVKKVSFAKCPFQHRGLRHIFQQNLDELSCNPYHPGTDWILGSAIPRIYGASVRRRVLQPIFDTWMTTVVLENWKVRVEDLDEEDIFDLVNAFEFLDFDTDEPLPTARPLVFSHQDEIRQIFSFFILREDQKMIRLAIDDPYVSLEFPTPAQCPPAVRNL